MKPVWRIGKQAAGGALIALGVVGLVLPGIQGIACIVLGAYLLGFEKRHFLSGLARLERRFPWMSRGVARLRTRLER
jgi:hypothetical protein